MTLTEFASIADVVSGAAVVVSFVFLAVQIRQNTQNQRATIHHDRISHLNDFMQPLLTNRETMEAYIRCGNGDDTIDATACNQYLWFQYVNILFFQEYFLMRREGMVTEERFQHAMGALKAFAPQPGMRASFRYCQEMLAPSFRAYVEDLMQQIPLEEGSGDRSGQFKDMLAAERAAARQTA